MDSKLANIDERQLVGSYTIEQKELHYTIGHKIDSTSLHSRSKFGIADISQVGFFHASAFTRISILKRKKKEKKES